MLPPKKRIQTTNQMKKPEVVGWVGKEVASFLFGEVVKFTKKSFGFGQKPQDVAMWLGVTRSLRGGRGVFLFLFRSSRRTWTGKTWCFVKCVWDSTCFVCYVFLERLWILLGVYLGVSI